jgi:ABC-type oligopeptide transport system substrate-binding subunit
MCKIACCVCSPGFSLLLLPACSKRETPTLAGIRTQTLLLGNGAEPVDLDPHMVTANSDANILYALFEGLTGTNEKTYTIQFLHWIADFADPISFLEVFKTNDRNNPTNWSNATYDRLLAEAANTADARARFEFLQQAEAVLLEEVPITPVDHVNRVYLLHPAVKNWTPTVLGQFRYQLVSLEVEPTASSR